MICGSKGGVTVDEEKKYYALLSEKYPTMRSLSREIINLTAILNLPKGTEHFMSVCSSETACPTENAASCVP